MRYLSVAKVAIQGRIRPARPNFPGLGIIEEACKKNLKIVTFFYIHRPSIRVSDLKAILNSLLTMWHSLCKD
jgi:hypothetical protein